MSVEDKYAQSIAIVYPAIAPSDDYNLPIDREINTHVTISFLGEIPDADFGKEEVVAALRDIEWENVAQAGVGHLDLFGLDHDFLVMTLDAPELQNNWNRVNEALAAADIPLLNRYPDYKPHITLRENFDGTLSADDELPETVELGAPILWWGTEEIPLSQ